MTKRYLTLIRHASAVSTAPGGDFHRPLKKKGIDKIRSNTRLIIERGYTPDLIVSSPAVRALQTAERFMETSELSFLEDEIIIADELYLPSPEEIHRVVKTIDDSFTDIFIFSHNNGLSYYAQDLCPGTGIIMPTASVVRIEVPELSWSGLTPGSGSLIDFIP